MDYSPGQDLLAKRHYIFPPQDTTTYPAELMTIAFPKQERELRVQTIRNILWYRGSKTEPVMVVLVRDVLGQWRDEAPVATEAVSADALGMEPELVTLSFDGTRHEVNKRSVVLGRSRDCDIQLTDANVSRRHVELRQEGASYWIVDLGSTNGMEVNGKRVKRAKLRPGDTITLGSTEITFNRETK